MRRTTAEKPPRARGEKNHGAMSLSVKKNDLSAWINGEESREAQCGAKMRNQDDLLSWRLPPFKDGSIIGARARRSIRSRRLQ
jgi:hypothetical protein